MRQLVWEKENSEFKPLKLRLIIDLVSYPARAEGLVDIYFTAPAKWPKPTIGFKYTLDLVHHINVTLLWNSDCHLVYVFKPKWSDYSMFWNSHTGCAFHSVEGLQKHALWAFCTPVHTVIAIDMYTEPKVCFIVEFRILLNRILAPGAHHETFFFFMLACVSLSLMWILYAYSWRSYFRGLFNDTH